MRWLFELRGSLTGVQRTILELIGLFIFLLIWYIVTAGQDPMVASGILPAPFKVLTSFKDLYVDNSLLKNTFHSIGLNLSGYIIALILTLPIGFLIGLYPLFRGTFHRLVIAIRFTPLALFIGLFIIWFGIGTGMKATFLAVGIFIFLLPIIVQRIDEVKDVYLKTVYTIGATDWQTIKTVYIPSVMSKFFDDLRVLTAISWTYIAVIEGIGSHGGLGNIALYAARRQGRIDKMFAILVLIIIIGIIQDRIFVYLDRELFPHKYQNKQVHSTIDTPSLWRNIKDYAKVALGWISLVLIGFLLVNELIPMLGELQILSYLFGDTLWSVVLIFICVVVYKAYKNYMSHGPQTIKAKLSSS